MPPKKILIVYQTKPIIDRGLIDAFARLGIEAKTFYVDENNHFVDKYLFHFINKQAHNLRILKKSKYLFTEHPLSHQHWMSKKFLEIVDVFKPDLIFSIQGPTLEPSVLKSIQTPKMAWWVEPESQMHRMPELAKPYDWYFCFSQYGLKLLQDIGVKHCSYLPHAVDRASFYPIPNVTKRWDLVFVGKHSAHREAMIMAALAITKRVAVYGPRWLGACLRNPKLLQAYKGSSCYGKKLNRLYSASKMVLNVIAHQQQGKVSSGINMRPFEILSSGSLLVSDEYQETEMGLVSGKNCIFYQNAEELKSQLKELLGNPQKLMDITDAGHQFLADQFSYDVMAREILDKYALVEKKH